MITRPTRATVRVPASAANLGPGFDAFGLALDLHDEVTVTVVPGGLSITVEGEGAADVPRDERHLVLRALRAACGRAGAAPPGLEIACRNRIPHGRGLGSSAAAIVAGLLLGRALGTDGGRRLDTLDLLRLATEIEGHPDNVAACLLGGLTVAWRGADGVRAVPLPVAADLTPVVLVAPAPVSTDAVRRLLPSSVPHGDAAANAVRAALLVEALARRPDLLLDATEDRLHQPYRAGAMPDTAALVTRLRAGGIPAVVSGAGPSVLALTGTGGLAALPTSLPAGWAVMTLGVDRRGASVDVE